MERLQAFKFELQPNGEQAQQMRRFAGTCRFVYNKALALQKANHETGGKFIGYVAMAANLPVWKREAGFEWLKESPSQALQHALKDLETAYKNFFEKRADFPRFKKKGLGDSFRYPDPKQIKLDQGNGRIFLPKLGWLRYRNSREVLGEVRNATVSQSGGKWFVSIQTRREVEPVQPTGGIVGIDMGIARFATLSDGAYLEPLHSFKKHQQRLAKYQRRMARKVKFSANWKKAKAKVTQVHIDIGHARKDYLHKASTTISQNHAMVCIEDLQIRNMSKSAKGNAETHGKQVRQKSGLNRSILDQGWGEFRRQLDYKLAWRGGHLITVPPHHTSRTCPCCGHVSADNRRTQAKFECVACGYENNADVVGAINVLERGQRLLACGELAQSGRSAKQEPAEV
ncbi:MAG: transposase, partial [Alphaproteobacteria bacterium]|nr:transposase [Alphaproteobacteria bacterium]